MERLTKLVKLLRVDDLAVRRNPLGYNEVRAALTQVETAKLAGRRDWTQSRLREVLWNARRSALERTALCKTPFVIHRPAVREHLRATTQQRGHA